MIIGLRTVIYGVSDLVKAKAWYSKAIGKQPYFDQPFYVGYSVGGFELGLDPNGEPGKGGTVAYWAVENAEEALKNLIAIGGTLRSEVQDVGEGIKVGTVADPFGNSFGIIENPHFKPQDVR